MSTAEIVVLIVVVLVLLAVAGYVVAQQRKRKQLRSRFGPEYDRAVETSGDRRHAERDLADRAERRRELDIRPLPEQERRAFADRWREAQEEFVDHPATAVRQADRLVGEVMERRGYPVGDFDQQARDVSVDHGQVVEEYRAAHDISQLNDRDQASTEDLRQAMVHYRALFSDLLDDDRGADTDDRTLRDRTPDDRAGRVPASDVGYAGDEDRHTRDDRSDGRRVVDGGLVRPDSEPTTDRDAPRDVR